MQGIFEYKGIMNIRKFYYFVTGFEYYSVCMIYVSYFISQNQVAIVRIT